MIRSDTIYKEKGQQASGARNQNWNTQICFDDQKLRKRTKNTQTMSRVLNMLLPHWGRYRIRVLLVCFDHHSLEILLVIPCYLCIPFK